MTLDLLQLPTWIFSLILAPFGLVVGSFCNVLIHRLPMEAPEDRDVVAKGSHCPSCRTPIKPWHNVPLLGWLWLRGKCAACGWHIPFRYPLVELLGGLIWAASPWIFPVGTLVWAKGLICFMALLVLFFTDFTEYILPDVIQFPLMVLGLAFTLPQIFLPERLLSVAGGSEWTLLRVDLWTNGLQPAPLWPMNGHVVDLRDALIGMVAGYGIPAAINQIYKWIRKADGLGMGDFKMLAWLGAFWGWGAMLGIFFGAVVLMSAVIVPLLVLRKGDGQTMLPLGCTLALATPPLVFFGPALWMGYLGWVAR
jgi:prepilin signal peptidase PulO-like enzyme (type II secretory pathway)